MDPRFLMRAEIDGQTKSRDHVTCVKNAEESHRMRHAIRYTVHEQHDDDREKYLPQGFFTMAKVIILIFPNSNSL